ncbi:MAG: hypothetical protein R2748_23670 [Bryobacterales bacterium]
MFLVSTTIRHASEITIDADAAQFGGEVTVLRADAASVVVVRTSDYGFQAPLLKYFFDPRSKTLRARRVWSRSRRLWPPVEARARRAGASIGLHCPAARFAGGFALSGLARTRPILPG